jgi:adenosylmethionine---8-amino-7-oxononanoate aminotransferase
VAPKTSMDPLVLADLDRAHVWHPYSPMPAERASVPVAGASGVYLGLTEPFHGQTELIDGMSSWWTAIHGYRHPVLDRAASDQLSRMSHVMFGGLTHDPAVRLCAQLTQMTPGRLEHVFLSDSGSVAVEVALKMCLQNARSRGDRDRNRFLTWRGGYHGDTFLAMSVCDPTQGMHRFWEGILPEQVFVDRPPSGFDTPPDPAYDRHLESWFKKVAAELAGVIVEPVVQGAGGMRFHNPHYLKTLRELCTQYEVPLVLDEIASGFWRTGRRFAAEHAGIEPDVMCVGKALTGGYLSLAATLCTGEIAAGIAHGQYPVLAHGPTFMGNPLACAIANASIHLLAEGDPEERVERIEYVLEKGLHPASGLPGVADVRVLGAIAAIEMVDPVNVEAATAAAARVGVWIRPFGRVVYSMPPYVATDEEVETIARALVEAARKA